MKGEKKGGGVIRRIRDRRNETNEEHVGGTIRGGLGDSNGSGIIRSQDREGGGGGEKLVGREEEREGGAEGEQVALDDIQRIILSRSHHKLP